MKQLFLIVLIACPFLINAQNQATGNLTIFSEDGDKFTVILNGEKQNEIPQANLRIEDLPQPYYSVRIIFKDPSLAPISKNNLYVANPDGTMMDVTYKIKKDKEGKTKLNYYSMIPVQQNYVAPANVYVSHFGNPNRSTETTTVTTTDNTSMGVNVNGVSMNVSINPPVQTTSTTITTTTTGDNTNSSYNNSTCSGWPMKLSDFNAAKKSISDNGFEDTKLSTAKSIASANCLSTDEVVEICSLFGFEDSKLAFAKFAYKHTTDPKNYFKVVNVFSFDSSKQELNKFISGE